MAHVLSLDAGPTFVSATSSSNAQEFTNQEAIQLIPQPIPIAQNVAYTGSDKQSSFGYCQYHGQE